MTPQASDRPTLPRLLICVAGDRIGDALLKLPLVKGLRKTFPSHHITWMTLRNPSAYARGLKPLVENAIDEFIECSGLGSRVSDAFVNRMPSTSFDTIISTEQRLLPNLALRRLRAARFITPAARFSLSDEKMLTGRVWPESVPLRLQYLFEIAAGKPAHCDYDLTLPEKHIELAQKILPSGTNYFGISPGAGGEPKRWPLENFVEIAQVVSSLDAEPVFFLGPEEMGYYEHLKACCPDAVFAEQSDLARTADVSGPLLSIALARRLKGAVANDSGGGHLLAAGGMPLISLFGHTSAAKFTPNTHKGIVLRAESFGGERVDAIPVQVVAKAVRKILKPA